jgi:hypothetical protein
VVTVLTEELVRALKPPRSLVVANASRLGRDLATALAELLAREGEIALAGPWVATSIPAAKPTAVSAAVQRTDMDDFANMPRH